MSMKVAFSGTLEAGSFMCIIPVGEVWNIEEMVFGNVNATGVRYQYGQGEIRYHGKEQHLMTKRSYIHGEILAISIRNVQILLQPQARCPEWIVIRIRYGSGCLSR